MVEETKIEVEKEAQKEEPKDEFDKDNEFLEGIMEEVAADLTPGPTDEEVAAWKKKHGKVYLAEILDKEYIYRGITRGEVRAISKQATTELLAAQRRNLNMSQEEQVEFLEDVMREMEVRICVLYPDLSRVDFNDPGAPESLAGVVRTLSEAIDEASGFGMKSVPREL